MSQDVRTLQAMFWIPDRCAVCRIPGVAVCSACALALPPPPDIPPPPGLDGFEALFAYRAGGRRMLSALKFGNRRGSVRWLGHALALRFDQNRLRRCHLGAVISVGPNRAGLRHRQVVGPPARPHVGLAGLSAVGAHGGRAADSPQRETTPCRPAVRGN